MRDFRDLLIVALFVAAGVLGYLYYQQQNTSLNIKAPGFELKGQ